MCFLGEDRRRASATTSPAAGTRQRDRQGHGERTGEGEGRTRQLSHPPAPTCNCPKAFSGGSSSHPLRSRLPTPRPLAEPGHPRALPLPSEPRPSLCPFWNLRMTICHHPPAAAATPEGAPDPTGLPRPPRAEPRAAAAALARVSQTRNPPSPNQPRSGAQGDLCHPGALQGLAAASWAQGDHPPPGARGQSPGARVPSGGEGEAGAFTCCAL